MHQNVLSLSLICFVITGSQGNTCLSFYNTEAGMDTIRLELYIVLMDAIRLELYIVLRNL